MNMSGRFLLRVITGTLALALPSLSNQTFAQHDTLYVLHTSDTIEVKYLYTPEYNVSAKVDPQGYVSLDLVGPVKVVGLTVEQAAAAIRSEAATQLNNPQVTVLLKDFVQPSFVVAGEVQHPGSFDMHGPISAVQAIAISGGFKETALRRQVILVRKVNAQYARTTLLNMKTIMTAKGMNEDTQVLPGDILIVPESSVGKLDRYIRWGTSTLYGVAIVRP